MDFENIFKSRSIIYKMLHLRGYDTSDYDSKSKEELNILYQNHKKTNEALDIFITGQDNKILVKYILSGGTRGKNLEKLIDLYYEGDKSNPKMLEDNDTLVIITKDQVNFGGSLEENVNRHFDIQGRFIQLFWLNSLLFDKTTHVLNPKYRILSEEEKQEVLDRYKITEKQVNDILVTDPTGSFYGIKVGQMVEVKRTSETTGYSISYRICKSKKNSLSQDKLIIKTPDSEDYTKLYQNYNLENRITDPTLNKFDYTACLGLRATEISQGAEPLIKITEDMNNPVLIAAEEIRQRKCPYIIQKKLGNVVEYWKLEDLQDGQDVIIH